MTDHHYSEDQLALDLKWWAAANYLTVAQIYLKDNTLLREPLRAEHIKPRLLGHWGTSPGLSMIYTLLNRHIVTTDADWLYVTGPGHGGPALVASTYLEGTYSEIYPEVSDDAEGIHRMCRRFSAPGGVPSHVSVQTPGSIHEGGELGYALAHAAGAAFDHPNLVVACVIGDGEAETGPLSGSWKLPAFLNPRRDGAVLPILHVNGAKISGPTVYGRSSDEDIQAYLGGQGWAPIVVSGDDPDVVFPQLYQAISQAHEKIREMQRCRTPRRGVDGFVAGNRLADAERMDRSTHRRRNLGRGHTSCAPGAVVRRANQPNRICGNSKSGCGRTVRTSCSTPTDHSSRTWRRSRRRGTSAWGALPTRTVDDFESISRCRRSKSTRFPSNPRVRPSTRRRECSASFCATSTPPRKPRTAAGSSDSSVRTRRRAIASAPCSRQPTAAGNCRSPTTMTGCPRTVVSWRSSASTSARGGSRVICLSGRHGMFASYEAFAMVSVSMLIQHAKWLQHAVDLPWRASVASLNVLLTSTCWRNDHNGFSHQGPGMIDAVIPLGTQCDPRVAAAGFQHLALDLGPLPA